MRLDFIDTACIFTVYFIYVVIRRKGGSYFVTQQIESCLRWSVNHRSNRSRYCYRIAVH